MQTYFRPQNRRETKKELQNLEYIMPIKVKKVEAVDLKGQNSPAVLPVSKKANTENFHFVPAIATDLAIGNVVWVYNNSKFEKVKIVSLVPTLGYKVKPSNEETVFKNGKFFMSADFFVKID